MRVKKEVAVLLGTVLVLGILWLQRSEPQAGRVRGKSGDERPRFVEALAPDSELVRTAERNPALWERDPFARPAATRPLAPLALEMPPLDPLPGLLPPPALGPEPAHFGRFLSRPVAVRPVPRLFAGDSDGDDDEDPDADAQGDPYAFDDGSIGAARELGYVGTPERLEDLSPAEREERLASWRRLYDWVRLSELKTLYGTIQNEDPFGLAQRLNESILFLEVDPVTGLERYPGQGPVPYPRERVIEFEFADTPEHRIAEWRHAIGDKVSPGQFPEVLAFVHECIDLRLEAPRALATAREVANLLIDQYPAELGPRLALARTQQAAFELEQAWSTYQDTLKDFGHRAEVHIALGELEADLRLFASAEQRFRTAERLERANWRVHQALAGFLAEQGRWQEALASAEDAHRFEPVASYRAERVAIRNQLGRLRLANGDPRGAREIFEQVLAIEERNPLAHAGLHAAWVLDPQLKVVERIEGLANESAFGFELLLGLAVDSLAYGSLDAQEAARARSALEASAAIDPLRAHQAWRALSWLAEVTGYPEEAYQFVERAHEADPTDAWTLYQRGRILAQRDDPEGAEASFLAALEVEAQFEDALVALADLAARRTDRGAAERYFEAAIALDPERADVHARRGLNHLDANELGAARRAFERALELDSDAAVARCGLAWCAYREGAPDRARQLYAEVDDRRRNLGEADPFRIYARAQMERIESHLRKELWTDRFERTFLRNGWQTDELPSPTVAVTQGALAVRGQFAQDGQVRVYRSLAAPRFVSFEAVLTVGAGNNARVGIFVAKERQTRDGGWEATSEVAIGRHRDGPTQIKVRESSSSDAAWVDLEFPEWPVETPVRVRIEREGEGTATTGRLVIDDFTVLEGAPLRSLFASTSDLRFGIVVEGASGRDAELVVDAVDVVRTTR